MNEQTDLLQYQIINKQLKTKKKMKTQTTNQIIKEIKENGGFCNLNNWNRKEVSQWVKSSYNCSTYVANNVAFRLI